MIGRVLSADATAAAFPLGGIGTGNVSIGARGELRDWELANRPGKGVEHPYSFFAIHVRPEGGTPITRVLEARRRPPFEDDQGRALSMAGLPRLADTRFRGEYPLLELEFVDDRLPVDVSLTAFTPLVPLDVDASSYPAAVLRYRVENPGDTDVDVTVAGTLMNPLGCVGRDGLHFPVIEGRPRNEWRDTGSVRGIAFLTDLPADHLQSGSACLVTTSRDVTSTPQWLVDFWQDGAQRFWDDLTADGRLGPAPVETLEDVPANRLHPMRVGSLAITRRLAPGEAATFEFLFAWHVPNRPRSWLGNIGLDATHREERIRNEYAARWADAWSVAADLARNLPALERSTRAFHDALFGSTLPLEVVDAVSATLAAARSTTCLWLEGRVFAAYEGSFDRSGSCEGTCTHVWTYAQGLAFVFPELERSARRTEFLHETRPDGRMNFRANSPFDNAPWDFHPAIDGQMGSIVRLYREWALSGDQELLDACWPAAKRALDFVEPYWDGDGDGLPDRQQHNTYDIEFYGQNPLATSMLLAALLAGEAMAAHLGDDDAAGRYRDRFERGSAAMDARLWNGEYYEQRLPEGDDHRYQVGTGCLSDQLLGQTLAHVAGLGYVVAPDRARGALAAIHRHNFRPDLTGHESVQRAYALEGEGGLLLCTWPRGGRPELPLVYADEVWTGIEYQVAAGLVYEGLVAEGLELVRAVRERHDGVNRNPWNETECGNHYARSLASWAVLAALVGLRVHLPSRTLEVAPRLPFPLTSFFATGQAWGRVTVDSTGIELAVDGGCLDLARVRVTVEGTVHDLSLPPLAAGTTHRQPF
jgi:uncharacterized protein (DUF608 family)